MSKENDYKAQLEDLGVYTPAFDGEIHTLCILERELSRTMKEWKATAPKGQSPSTTDPLYDVICRQRRDILTHRDALGLTPKALQRLRKAAAPSSTDPAPIAGTPNQGFAALMNRIQEATHGKE